MKVLPHLLVMALSASFLWHFSNIARYGRHTIQEPNNLILISEIAMMVGIFGFGCWSYLKETR